MVINKTQVKKNILDKKFQLIDARSKERFSGLVPEPRKGLKSGHIKGSKNIPFQLLLNDDRTFKKKFSVRPPPGVIVEQVERSLFYKSIETFGTAIAQNSKTYRIKTSEVAGKLNIDNRFVKKVKLSLGLQAEKRLLQISRVN